MFNLEITTVEGILDRVVTGLEQHQERRRKEEPETAKKIDEFIESFNNLKALKSPFKLVIIAHILNFLCMIVYCTYFRF